MNPKSIWSKTDDINLIRKSCEDICLNNDGRVKLDHGIAANTFHDNFINISKNLLRDPEETNNQYHHYIKNPNKHYFFIKEVKPHQT